MSKKNTKKNAPIPMDFDWAAFLKKITPQKEKPIEKPKPKPKPKPKKQTSLISKIFDKVKKNILIKKKKILILKKKKEEIRKLKKLILYKFKKDFIKFFNIKRKKFSFVQFKTIKGWVKSVKTYHFYFQNFKGLFKNSVSYVGPTLDETLNKKYYNLLRKKYLVKKNIYKKINKTINKNLKKRFLYSFIIKKKFFIKKLFVRTFSFFTEKLKQALYLIKKFPKFLIKISKLSLTKNLLEKFLNKIGIKSIHFYNFENLKRLKVEFAKKIKKILYKSKNLKNTKHFLTFLTNNFYFRMLKQSVKNYQNKYYNAQHLLKFNKWVKYYLRTIREKCFDNLYGRKKRAQEYAVNYRLLKEKFKNNLTAFTEYQKEQDRKNGKIKKKPVIKPVFNRSRAIIHRLKTKYLAAKEQLLRNINLIPGNAKYKNYIKNYPKKFKITFQHFDLIKKLAALKTNVPPDTELENYQKISLKFSFISTRLLNVFITALDTIKNNNKYKNLLKLDHLNIYFYKIYNRFKQFSLNKIKRNILFLKKIPTSTNFISLSSQINNINILRNKSILVKARFHDYMQNNLLLTKMNLMQNLQVTNLLQNTSDILRAEHFRNLLNREDAFFENFYKQQPNLQLLTTVTGFNIYLTLFDSNPYKILWKASSGMLGLKRFRRAKKHQMTFKDLLIRCQVFLARNRMLLRKALHLKIRYLKYYGTKNFLSFFIRQKKDKDTFEILRNAKIFQFYRKAKHLCNNHVLQFMTMVWSRARKKYFGNYKSFKCAKNKLVSSEKNKFKAFRQERMKSIYSARFMILQRDPRVIKYYKKNPYIIKKKDGSNNIKTYNT